MAHAGQEREQDGASSALSRVDRVSLIGARVGGAVMAVFAGAHVVEVVQSASKSAVMIAVIATAVAIGMWRRRPLALQVGAMMFLLLAILLPVGIVNPFHAMQSPAIRPPAFAARSITLALAASVASLALAFMSGRARVALRRAERHLVR